MQGFLGGVSIGAVVAVIGATAVSLWLPLPKAVDVAADTPLAVNEPRINDTAPVKAAHGDADLVEATPSALDTAIEDDLSTLTKADRSSTSRPDAQIQQQGLAQTEAPAPNEVQISVAQSPSSTAPVTDATPSVRPQAAAPVPDLDISTETAAPVPPGPPAAAEPALADASTLTEIAPPAAPKPDAAAAPDRPENALAASDADTLPVAGTAGIAPTAPVKTTPPVPAKANVADAPVKTNATPVPSLKTATTDSDVSVTSASQTPPQPLAEAGAIAKHTLVAKNTPEIAQDVPVVTAPKALDAPTDLPQTVDQPKPVPLPFNRDDTAKEPNKDATRRVVTATDGQSRIGKPALQLTSQAELEPETVPVKESPLEVSPFQANAEPFDLIDDRPLMSIVLIDDEEGLGAEALAGFPYPISFAISPEDSKLEEKVAARRAAGFEVLMLVDLAQEARPQDAETALEVWSAKMPEALGVIEGIDTGFQGNRPLADQIATVAKARGYGMVMQDNGLNTVQKLALRDGVPAGVVFRDFDGAGQTPRAMRRFLDQAAFRAGQEGAVIMLGRLRPDTVSALLLWGLQDRAGRVQLAPISASLDPLNNK